MKKIVSAMGSAFLLLLLAGAVNAGEPKRYLLQIKARPGETYRDVVSVTSTKSIPIIGFERTSFGKMTIRTVVKAVQPNGRMILDQKVVDFRLTYTEPGIEWVVDSTDSDRFKALLDDKEMGPIVREIEKGMRIPVRVEMEPNGSVRRFDAKNGPAANVLEEAMTAGSILLPSGRVAIHESWETKDLTIEPSILGRTENSLTMTLRRVGTLGGEPVAYIDLKGRVTSFTPDDMLGVPVELKESESGGLIVLALDRGRILSYSYHGSRVYNVVDKGEGMTMRFGYEVMTKEAR